MLDQHIKIDFNSSDIAYTNFLVNSIQSGIYSDLKENWVKKMDLMDRNSLGHINVIIDWAVEGNKYGCSFVWKSYEDDPLQDFSGEYYVKALPFLDYQIAKGFILLFHVRWISIGKDIE